MLQEMESILQKDQRLVVEGGISYDDFNNGIRMRARKIEPLETWRLNHARAIHIDLRNGNAGKVEQLARDLGPFQIHDCIPLVFHGERDGYQYELKTESWTLNSNEQCILTLEKLLGKRGFSVRYS